MKRFLRLLAGGLGLAVNGLEPVLAADQICGACDRTVLVRGEFEHRTTPSELTIRGAPRRKEEAFKEAIFGTNISVAVPNLDPGKYTAVFGFAEIEASGIGDRWFDIRCGEQVLATNLDILAETGGQGRVHSVTFEVTHAGDPIQGPLTFTLTGRRNTAMLSTFELRNASRQSLVSMRVADLIDSQEAEAVKAPKIPGPLVWKDAALPVETRVKDLVSRMSLAEKVAQMRNGAPAIPRLGLPAYDYWNECLHGVARAGAATVFPQAIGLAATWDVPLIRQVADVIATEARAKHHEYARTHDGDSARYFGLTFWTPNINLFRDPRWGRGQETYGEDPFLTSRMGVAFIRGLQGTDPKYIKAMACAKHFAVHSGPESERHRFNAVPPERDLYESYLPQFEAAVREGRAGAVMGAYNRLNGEPACSNPFLLADLLRGQWGFDGHVVSDCGAIYDIYANHQTTANSEAAAARAVKAGCDLCCGADYTSLARAVRKKLITSEEIDRALGRLLTARFRLGLFDPPDAVSYARIPVSENDTSAHENLALRAARESIVLLKNDGLLPLQRNKLKRIAVIGANADSVPALQGNYFGVPARPVTILSGIQSVAGPGIEVVYAPGCALAVHTNGSDALDPDAFARAVQAAKIADVVVYVGGLTARLEGEEMVVACEGFASGDRTRIELPGVQTHLLRTLKMAGKPLVFVNCSGSAMAMPWEMKNVQAILQAWYPGEQGGRAVGEVLFGEVNPAGRTPVTFYRATTDLPAFEDYSMSNRTYRYFAGHPQFAFGHGLSYTRFEYRKAKLSSGRIRAGETLQVTFNLKNSGPRDGEEIAQLYVRRAKARQDDARLALCGFARVGLNKGQTARLALDIPVERFRTWNPGAKRYVVEPGAYEILLGAASDDIRCRLALNVSAD